jgi:ubiquinone/menaquinone biosynthesis C-methylase UbiE
MAKTQKELAFLRDLFINDSWTKRFTGLIDKHFKFEDEENLLYLNAGTGAHALELSERIGKKTDIFATCENEDILHIAHDKAAAVRSTVDFSMIRFEDGAFDAVIADASFARAAQLIELLDEALRVAKNGANIGVLLVSAGSFGEIFSLLWEVLFNEDLGEHGHAAEAMVTALPTVTGVEELAEKAGLVNIQIHTASEIFEYENGKEFIESPLVDDFLLPAWLETLNENEGERVRRNLGQLIDSEDGNLTFRFSVKAMLLTGEKA